jgi:hypothetical protein
MLQKNTLGSELRTISGCSCISAWSAEVTKGFALSNQVLDKDLQSCRCSWKVARRDESVCVAEQHVGGEGAGSGGDFAHESLGDGGARYDVSERRDCDCVS